MALGISSIEYLKKDEDAYSSYNQWNDGHEIYKNTNSTKQHLNLLGDECYNSLERTFEKTIITWTQTQAGRLISSCINLLRREEKNQKKGTEFDKMDGGLNPRSVQVICCVFQTASLQRWS